MLRTRAAFIPPFSRPVVKQYRGRPTPGSRGCDSFPGDHFQMRNAECRVRNPGPRMSAFRFLPSTFPLPRCITSSAPVSDTGGPGAIPGEAASFP